ncbi:hypothetical protein D5S17_17855 [Pseudonocardiaceae bacterium YIM PH 21723]|nr:hypothetical protein D5S17_17855 [Pseudonocardiaceae bacterium YIM PH 21723]
MTAQESLHEAAGMSEIAAATPMQKPLHPTVADLHLGNVTVPARFEPHRTAGFCTRMQDTHAERADEINDAYGLNRISGWDVGSAVYLLRFFAFNSFLYQVPIGGNSRTDAMQRGTGTVYPPPFRGDGYAPDSTHQIPEYYMRFTELPAGTEMWKIQPNGAEERVGRYANRQIGWAPMGGIEFGPARWWGFPAPLRPTVRRGLTAFHQGQDFDADFGPKPNEVTLHPLPGATAPEDFTAQIGAKFKVVSTDQLDGMRYLRQLCTWRGQLFEMVDANQQSVVLNYLGENSEIAKEIGLSEVDYRQWRAIAPRSELQDIRQEATDLLHY